jgi:hypothetical protein
LTSHRREDLTQEQFDQLLSWLNPDREQAALKYEQIRKRLIVLFTARGCHVPEELADISINTVARRVDEVREGFCGDPAHYFCGVARNVFLEHKRKEYEQKARLSAQPPVTIQPSQREPLEYRCFDLCSDELSSGDRRLIVEYYREQKRDKIENRALLAAQSGVSLNALRIKAYRLRAQLQKCLEDCINRLAAETE